MRLQREIGKFGAELERNEADTYAGHWIKHGHGDDDFGMVVRFTSNGDETIQRYGQYVADGPLAGMVEVRDADNTLTELKSLRSSAVASLKSMGVPFESSINVMENKAEIFVVDRNRLDSAMLNANVQLPNKVELVTVSSLSQRASEIYGGLKVESTTAICTSGFSVEDSSGTEGVTTAGHCDAAATLDMTYDSNNLPYQSGEFNEGYDIQWHTAPGLTVRNLVDFGHSYPRYIYDTVSTGNQSPNEYVCKYGIKTGYTCGRIKSKTYQPDDEEHEDHCHPNEDCNFTNDWIWVHNANKDLCGDSDSGGPVVIGNDAYGTVAFCVLVGAGGNQTWDFIYMPVDKIDDYGLTVLTD